MKNGAYEEDHQICSSLLIALFFEAVRACKFDTFDYRPTMRVNRRSKSQLANRVILRPTDSRAVFVL